MSSGILRNFFVLLVCAFLCVACTSDEYSYHNQNATPAPQSYEPQPPQYYRPPVYAVPQPAPYYYAPPASPYGQAPGSRYYSNPYAIPPSSQQNQYYDSDQYYVPPTYYNNVEPQSPYKNLGSGAF